MIIENGEDLFVVKGEYHSKERKWCYGGKGFDQFNIIAYDKSVLKTVNNEFLSIYAIDDKMITQAKKIEKVYKDIVTFFNGNLFPKKEIRHLDIASTYPVIKQGGGYQREGLLFCDNLGDR